MARNKYETPKWWKESVVLQVYPASFKDSNRDGWGDIRGIISKLDYIKHLGIDAIWLSPISKSPQRDMGYDISDYEDIDPIYGTLKDVDDLIAELRKRGMKLIMDMVFNHTSDQHAWFQDAVSSKSSSKRDWYVWKAPQSRSSAGKPIPPNNWASLLGDANSAWTYDDASGEYFLSLFTPQQPDLNWENAEVRQAVYDVMRFWLDRGASGFRLDVINCISKDQSFPDAEILDPSSTYQPGFQHFISGPRFHEFLHEMNREVLSEGDILTVGECDYAPDPMNEGLRTIAPDREELNSIFQFEYIDLDQPKTGSRFDSEVPWTAADLARITAELHEVMRTQNGWLTQVLENHDQPRSVGRFVPDSGPYVELGAKLLALVETTLAGTIYLYQGQELGARNMPDSWPVEEYKDVFSQNYWAKMMKSLEGAIPEEKQKGERQARYMLQRRARDHSRLPMMWDGGPNGGFCERDIKPWMKVHDDYTRIHAEAQMNQEDGLSVFQFWKRGLENRKMHCGAFVYGGYRGFDLDNKSVLAYERWTTDTWGKEPGQDDEKSRWLVACNLTNDQVTWEIPRDVKVKSWVAGNYSATKVEKQVTGAVILRPWEGILGACEY